VHHPFGSAQTDFGGKRVGLITRVTRLGQFSAVGDASIFEECYEHYINIPNFWAIFSVKKLINLAKYVFRLHFWRFFFAKASGHPAHCLHGYSYASVATTSVGLEAKNVKNTFSNIINCFIKKTHN
jgi:hypothetical protein